MAKRAAAVGKVATAPEGDVVVATTGGGDGETVEKVAAEPSHSRSLGA